MQRALDPGGSGELRAEHRVRGRDGVERWIAATGQVTFADGAPVRLVGTVQDVTARRRAEDELRESEGRYRAAARLLEESQERLALALAAGSVGIWEFSVKTGRGWWSPETYAIMGLAPDQFSGQPEAYFALVHPDDRAGVEAQLEESLARDVPFAPQYRIRRPDGQTRWVANIARVIRDAAGAPLRMVGTVRDVTEEHAIDQRRSDFLAVLSHELRNPLAPIGNALALLERAPAGSDLDRHAREVLRRQTQHLGRLVDDLLDVARISHGKIDLRLARIDAREVARRACDDVRAVFEERGLSLRCAEAPEPAWVEADPARLAQMIGNLLSNALKFTGVGGRVEVRVERGPSTCRVAVQDTGAGIAADELPHLFAPFMQAERTRARSQSGLGIGLALVQELAQRHGGKVAAVSGGIGQGSEFTIELPLAAAAERGAPPAPGAEAQGPLDILVAEDNEDAGATLAELLVLLGHSTRRVVTGTEAIREAGRAPPQVLLCDVGLPDVSGHDVIRSVRAQQRGAEIFAVALTGYAQPHDRAEALCAGFDAHVPKPPALEELQRLLREAGRRVRASRA